MKQLQTTITDLINSTKEPKELLQQSMNAIFASRDDFYWVGIYYLRGETLHLGPFAGPATDHIEIPVGRGVCGTAVATGQDQNVAEVGKLDNYLACNILTKSELVVLIRHPESGQILGQIDIDCTTVSGFSVDDEKLIQELAVLLAPATAAAKSPSALD